MAPTSSLPGIEGLPPWLIARAIWLRFLPIALSSATDRVSARYSAFGSGAAPRRWERSTDEA
jgi:hypothetical protein